MTRKRRYRWYWRVAMALVVFVLLNRTTVQYAPAVHVERALLFLTNAVGVLPALESAWVDGPIPGWKNLQSKRSWIEEYLLPGIALGLAQLPLLWVALCVYDRLTFASKWLDGYTRCGACGQQLHDLETPRCPKCGSTI